MTKSFNIPNVLTVMRIFALPLFMHLIMRDSYKEAVVLFIIGGLTDVLDGFIARRFNMVTPLGKFLDPLADKLFLVVSLAAFTYKGLIYLWAFLALVLRDLLVAAGSIIFVRRHSMDSIRPNVFGKLCNFLQFSIIVLILFDHIFVSIDLRQVSNSLVYPAVALSFISLISYFRRYRAMAPPSVTSGRRAPSS